MNTSMLWTDGILTPSFMSGKPPSLVGALTVRGIRVRKNIGKQGNSASLSLPMMKDCLRMKEKRQG